MARYELPKDWRWVRLGEAVSEIKSGFACGKQHAVPEGIPHLRTNNIGTNGELDLSLLIHLPAEIVDLNIYSLKSGDVLFNNTNSVELIGKTAIVRGDLPFVFSNHITRLRVKQDVIESEWLTLSLQYLWYQRFFEKGCQRWIGQAGFNTTRLKKVQIPLAPLPEQHRIVARIEELVSRIEEAKSLRHAAREETDAIMPAALSQIYSKMKEEGVTLRPLGEVCEVNPLRKGKMNYPDDMLVTFVPMSAVDAKLGAIVTPEERPFAKVKKGYTWFVENDVLFAKITPCMQNGKATIAKGLLKGVGFGSTEFHVLRPREEVLPEWIYFFVRRPSFRRLAEASFTGSVGQQRVPESFLKSQGIPLPSLDEQHRIATYLDHLQAKVVELRRLQEETEEEINATTSVILNMVFQGEL